MTMGLACDREGYDLRKCPLCGSRGCAKLHRYNGKCSTEPRAIGQSDMNRYSTPAVFIAAICGESVPAVGSTE